MTREEAINWFKTNPFYHQKHEPFNMAIEALGERKTGRWIVMETAYEDTVAKCSECGFETLVNEPGNGLHMVGEMHYCPNCGAMMEVEHDQVPD